MRDYDAIIIGGGINGLTTAAYLAKAGLSVGVFEARGQCGAHCDTVELGMPGYLHNTHAVWLVPAMSPAMEDLGLEQLGLHLRGTDVLFAKTFSSGTNVVQALDPAVTDASLAAASEHDAAVQATIAGYLGEHLEETLDMSRSLLYGPPTAASLDRLAAFDEGLLSRLGLPLSGDDVLRMTGLELLDMLFESEEVRTTPAALGEFTGQWPNNRRFGALALSLSGLQPMAVHTARGGSHAMTHALVKCVAAHGGEIWTTRRWTASWSRTAGPRASASAPTRSRRARRSVPGW
ncbi:MAG: FAD-dependent oxidoreductase [Microthrixaceae bacterium]|nr:FAD-dependent oxidoreductase [Microthrixaceae bacterium]